MSLALRAATHSARLSFTQWFSRYLAEPLIHWTIAAPLRHFYRVGWWGGHASAEICARITGVPVDAWSEFPQVCEALLQRRVAAVQAWALAVAYAVALVLAARWVWRRGHDP